MRFGRCYREKLMTYDNTEPFKNWAESQTELAE
jgi:hypothetical protein